MNGTKGNKKVRKAVIAAAGFGTRFLPQTKAMPKQMLPLVDKPIIQYIVEELVDAGIEDIIIVTGYDKRSIEDHFDTPSRALVENLQSGNKQKALEEVEAIANLANFVYVRQKGPYGNATPVMDVAHLLGNEPFIYTWSDDFIRSAPSRFKQMIEAYERLQGSVASCLRITEDKDYDRYGIVAGEEIEPGVLRMSKIVEKPGKEDAPSDLATLSGFLFTPGIIRYIEKQRDRLEEGQEFYIQPAIQLAIEQGEPLFACEIANGKFYDTGSKLDYLKTVVDFALMHDELKDDFQKFLRDRMS